MQFARPVSKTLCRSSQVRCLSEAARHRPVMNLGEKRPALAADVFVAPDASVVGNALLQDRSSVWYGAIVKADCNNIKIGAVSNIQEKCVLQTVSELETGFASVLEVGRFTSIGPGSIITSSTIGNGVTIGSGCIIGEGSVIEDYAIVSPGSVVPAGTFIKSGEFWAGNPAIKQREVSADEKASAEKKAEATAALASKHSAEFLPHGFAYAE